MKVLDYNKLSNLRCPCGFILYIAMGYKDKSLVCHNPDCDNNGIRYKFPESVYIELEKVE